MNFIQAASNNFLSLSYQQMTQSPPSAADHTCHMNQFVLKQGSSEELRLFPHILEMGIVKNSSIRLNTFPKTSSAGIKVFTVLEGKFEWCIAGSQYVLFPNDVAFVLPQQEFGSSHDVLEIGSFSWIHLSTHFNTDEGLLTGAWSALSESENNAISKILSANTLPILSKFNDGARILKAIHQELFGQELGFHARVNNLIDELFILIIRQLTKQSNPGRDFPKTFMNLEQALRQNLAHQWTVEEMAALVGLGTTLFNEKVKTYSGFSPINYLINIRIAEAIKLLKRPGISLTDIALDTGFYSSQHFSTTFKKLTGYTPSEFRKNHLSNNK
jgi:AraC-like DNA-binding protein